MFSQIVFAALLALSALAAGQQTSVTDVLTQVQAPTKEEEMSMLEMVKHHGYHASHFFVRTEDGHLIDVYRISKSKGESTDKLHPVLLVHGILQSSFRFILNGPSEGKSKAIAYQLADTGKFDVWLVNVRGNALSRGHSSLDADSDPDFWNFSFEEFGEKDIPAVGEHILKTSKSDTKLTIIGYSQGTTSLLYGMSIQSSAAQFYKDKVQNVVLLAPAIFFRGLSYPKLVELANNLFVFKFLAEFNYLEIASQDAWIRAGCQKSKKAS